MRVLLADDHALFRAGIASLLRASGFDVVGEASNGHEAVKRARELAPDLILMDIRMPDCSGLEATRQIRSDLPAVKIVMVTVSDDDADLFEAIKAGADGYLLKDMSEDDFGATLSGIAHGQAALSPALATKILGEFVRISEDRPPEPAEADPLTEREHDVLRLVADGATNREIASALFISENTVGFHMKNILGKLHLKNRSQAVAYAIRAGLVDGTD